MACNWVEGFDKYSNSTDRAYGLNLLAGTEPTWVTGLTGSGKAMRVAAQTTSGATQVQSKDFVAAGGSLNVVGIAFRVSDLPDTACMLLSISDLSLRLSNVGELEVWAGTSVAKRLASGYKPVAGVRHNVQILLGRSGSNITSVSLVSNGSTIATVGSLSVATGIDGSNKFNFYNLAHSSAASKYIDFDDFFVSGTAVATGTNPYNFDTALPTNWAFETLEPLAEVVNTGWNAVGGANTIATISEYPIATASYNNSTGNNKVFLATMTNMAGTEVVYALAIEGIFTAVNNGTIKIDDDVGGGWSYSASPAQAIAATTNQHCLSIFHAKPASGGGQFDYTMVNGTAMEFISPSSSGLNTRITTAWGTVIKAAANDTALVSLTGGAGGGIMLAA